MDFFAFVRKLFFFEEKLGEFEQPIQLNNSIARTSLLLLGLPPRQPSPKRNKVERVSRWETGKQSSHTSRVKIGTARRNGWNSRDEYEKGEPQLCAFFIMAPPTGLEPVTACAN